MSADFKQLPRCGAKIRNKTGDTCNQVAMANGRCYFHGGKSTGPKTKKGLLRMKQSKIKHGYYTQEKIKERKEFRHILQQAKNQLNNLLDGV